MRGVSPDHAVAFVANHGVVLESGAGAVPSLAEAIAGTPIRGSWWTHPKGRLIFRATRTARASPDVLVCRLLDRRITYVHRRLWPALVRLVDALGPRALDSLREEHTPAGAHRLVTVPFPHWVPEDVREAAGRLSEAEARDLCGGWLTASERAKNRSPATQKRRAPRTVK